MFSVQGENKGMGSSSYFRGIAALFFLNSEMYLYFVYFEQIKIKKWVKSWMLLSNRYNK